jgi:hypothetical protein
MAQTELKAQDSFWVKIHQTWIETNAAHESDYSSLFQTRAGIVLARKRRTMVYLIAPRSCVGTTVASRMSCLLRAIAG